MPTDDLKRLMEAIPLPDELRERSRAGIAAAALERELPAGRRGRRALAIAAALLALLVLSAGIANHDRVWAALRKTFQFSPGTGIVSEEDSPSERYVLKKPIVLSVGEGKITITGIHSDEEMTYVAMAGEQAPRVESLELVNERGEVFDITSNMGGMDAQRLDRFLLAQRQARSIRRDQAASAAAAREGSRGAPRAGGCRGQLRGAGQDRDG
ncbi:hypothetical protein [Cohnella rhizosphaerae]|uniref:Uncharacterized protein n=1 Tax=Cohnella rhizosphaerae TaxID=1457232 RepID=A0A9X4KW90_9BACL|nr:hypothetical protein [Cohnella rhizosphaerae]MDG0809152.1 hypothetical protein [Cohnella rhizosphaerae]